MIQATKLLGAGSQSKVYEAHFQEDNVVNSFAVKVFNEKYLADKDIFDREYKIL